MLRIGCGRVETTPALGLPMAGSPPWPRGLETVGPLRGRILLADDGANRVAIVCLDLMIVPASEVERLRARLAPIGDLDPGAILIAASHTHCAPFTFLGNGASEPEVFGYLDQIGAWLERAMAAAVADLRPAELLVGRIPAPGWAFNRRPIYAGDQVATHGPTWAEGFVRLEDDPDEEIQVLLAREPTGATIGGLVGFACHPTVMMGQSVYSSDYPGVLTDELERRHGGVFGFLLGASGDTANVDPADRAPSARTGWDHAQAMGRALAARADAALAGGLVVRGERVGFASRALQTPQRRPTAEQIEAARWYLEEAPVDLDEHAFTDRLSGHAFTFYDAPPRANERHARELLGMWEWQRRVGTRELIEDVEVQVLHLGDLVVTALPVELFASLGRALKRGSPVPHTFVATLANGWLGYAPTVEAFKRGGYETFLAYQSRLAPEAGERMVEAALALIDRLVEHDR